MFKLIKYELRGNLLTILGVCLIILATNLLLLTRSAYWEIPAVSSLSSLLSVVAIIIIFISSINLLSKYLYTDTGYLLFSLPKSGTSILLSKLITALIQITLVALVTILGFCLATIKNLDFRFLNYIKVSGIIYIIVACVCANILLLNYIYFCMVMSKVTLRNKALGKIGSFITFILLAILLFWLSSKLTNIFPQTITFYGSSFFKNINLTENNISISIHISNIIFAILVFVGFFKCTAYMIDNKLDL